MKTLFRRCALRCAAFLCFFTMSVSGLHSQTWGDGTYHNGMQYMMWGGQLPSVTASGKAILDSATVPGMMATSAGRLLYYVDSSGNGIKKYQLFFGPYWYAPAGGAVRPRNGDAITVRGGVYSATVPPILDVYQLNGQVWRDSTGPASWGGRWVHRAAADTTRIFCSGDSMSWIGVPPGAMGSGMMMGGGMMWPDSMFMEFDLMSPDSLPNMSRSGSLMGLHLNTFAPTGISMMQGGMMGGQGTMSMARSMQIRIYVHPDSLLRHGLTLGQMRVLFLDVDSTWQEIPGQSQNEQANVITAATSRAFPYLALAPTGATSAAEAKPSVPATFALGQNYPNPFNPTTIIAYSVGGVRDQGPGISNVRLVIYDVVGREVAVLVNERKEPGSYEVKFDGTRLASGVYFYRMTAGAFVQTRKMALMK